ncbi:hypothetical protein RF11_07874 [Thelohanellus kitauei]|uniref:E3 ubiquitin-protein ligase n=1 Tax=Thelohanellus kitauei TaxID=669202 RepID=A0A0C2ICY1_THEKT|nr:hypothetical protein RF11_07874 [Thelohanellus kitauei]
MEEVRSRVDSIIINGLLVTSNDTGTDPSQIYSKSRMEKIVCDELVEYIFEWVGFDVKEWFDSDEGKLEMCTRVLHAYYPAITCLDCEFLEEFYMCWDCFVVSEHVNHEYKRCYSRFFEMTCYCGDVDSCKAHSTCSKHSKAVTSGTVLPEAYLTKFGYIIQYLCELFEKICTMDFPVFDNHMEEMLEAYLLAKDSDTTPDVCKDQVEKCQNFAI